MVSLLETTGKSGPALMPGLSCAKTIGMTRSRLGQRLCRAEAASLLEGLGPVRATGPEGELLLDRSARPESAMPGAERSTLFLYDAARQALWASVAWGIQGKACASSRPGALPVRFYHGGIRQHPGCLYGPSR